ncbi:RICIN domain-containing protein [Saccharothrix algeriensis]|uniref:RICIN domain-containing protein n=1 Tax=Saccharothrix algeriensis TaxID=173560 RepID=A0A8T8I010_9PSEU|nr:RICIN domain-containing protein [Saccharothrix algeriensis]MBM7809680.1 hypothetical protein [Saccharothrix algeriensis]QTR03979.1 RICIN domain-containing protein [Saccharothrix algeriensis]
MSGKVSSRAVVFVLAVLATWWLAPAYGHAATTTAAGDRAVSEEDFTQLGTTWRFRNGYTDRCAAVLGSNNVNGAPVFQHDCLGYEDQEWIIESMGS